LLDLINKNFELVVTDVSKYRDAVIFKEMKTTQLRRRRVISVTKPFEFPLSPGHSFAIVSFVRLRGVIFRRLEISPTVNPNHI